jgi:hypothetical protein
VARPCQGVAPPCWQTSLTAEPVSGILARPFMLGLNGTLPDHSLLGHSHGVRSLFTRGEIKMLASQFPGLKGTSSVRRTAGPSPPPATG